MEGSISFSNSENINTDRIITLLLLCLLNRLPRATQKPFADNVEQDQTAQKLQSDLGSTLSDKEFKFLFPLKFTLK